MNQFSQNNDQLKEMVKKHEVQKPSDDFTSKVMNMVKAGVILEEDTEPLMNIKYVVAAAVVFIGLLLSSFVFDLSILDSQWVNNFVNSQQVVSIFNSYQEVTESLASTFGSLFKNNIMIISTLTIGFLAGLDKLLRKKSGHAIVLL